MNNKYTELHAASFGLALGILWGLAMGLVGLFAMCGYGLEFVHFMAHFYIGYAPTLLGGLIGLLFGFLDGFIGGAVFAWLYNFIAQKTCKQ